MLITRFNRMIRSRLLWSVFAVIISVSFVFTFSRGGGCRDTRSSRRAVGKLFGQNVMPEEFASAHQYELGLKRNVGMPPEEEEAFRARVWRRLAALKTAERFGIVATDRELAETLQRDQTFQENGVFSAGRYRNTVRQQLGVAVPAFESYVRQELTLGKLRDLAGAFTLGAPLEVRERATDFADRRRLEYIFLDRRVVAPPVPVTREQALDFYKANTNRFEVPEQARVAYVRFDVSNFLGRIDVLETNVMAYYREHPEFYSVTGTNGETSARPFAEVKADAERRLRLERASAAAEEAAATLAFKLVPGRLTTAVPLVQAAAAAGIAVHTTGLFSASATLPGVDAKSFSRIALELDPADASLRFSDAIVGSNAVYVAECLERREKYIPAFDAVSADVMPLAASNAAARVFEERVQKARADIVAALADGKSFRTAAGALGFNVATTAVFAVYGGLPEGAPFADALPGAVASLDKHEVSEATPVAGGVLLAYVADRIPAESATIDLLCAQMQNSMIRYRAGAVFRAWTEDMLTAAAFTDLVATASQDLPPAPIDDFLDL